MQRRQSGSSSPAPSRGRRRHDEDPRSPPGRWQVRLNTDSKYYDSGFGDFGVTEAYASSTFGGHDGFSCKGDVAVAPYSALILSQDRW